MGRNSTKTTAAKTATVYIYRKLNHFVCRNGATFFVFWMWQSGVWQIKNLIYLFCFQISVGRIYYNKIFSNLLYQSFGALHHIRLYFNYFKVRCKGFFVL